MTIHDVTLAWSRSNGGVTLSADGKQASAKFSDGWQVTHSYDATEVEILDAPGLPTFSSYKPGTFVPCTGFNIEERGLLMSIVRVDYDKTITRNDNSFDWNQSPLAAPPIIRWEDETTTEPLEFDLNGNSITNANGENINGATIELSDPVLLVTRNFAAWNPHVTHQYRRSVNSDTFASFPAGTARLAAAPAELIIDPTFGSYWRVAARIRFRYPYNTTAEKAWWFRTVHTGFKVKVGSDVKHAVDDEKPPNRVVTPVLLKADGSQLEAGGTPTYREFQRYQPLPYANLGLL